MHEERLSIELKSVSTDEPGSFEGALSTYGNTDLTGDSVLPGAFTKTLKDNGSIVPLFKDHDHSRQIGVLRLQDTPTALVARGKLNLDLKLAQDVYSNMLFNAKHGVKTGLSIGYRTVKEKMAGPVRQLVELALKEGSICLWPANEQALVSAVKSEAAERETAKVLATIEELRKQLRSSIADMDSRRKEFDARRTTGKQKHDLRSRRFDSARAS
jgi:HK97 family phage prohead protease